MSWLIVLLGYILGSLPVAYLAGRIKGVDIRRVGDRNMGAANAFRQLGAKVGIIVGLFDAGKGAVAILVSQAAEAPQLTALIAGAAAVIGHNWPVFLGFRGGRGESTTIGVLLSTIPQPMLLLMAPTLLVLFVKKNVILASAVLFIPLPVVSWLLDAPASLITYSIALPCLVGVTHFLRVRKRYRPSPTSSP